MTKAKLAAEAIVRVRNRTGVLAQVTRSIAEKGVNIEAVVATAEGGDAVVRLVTSNHLRTMTVLREQRPEVQEANVVVAEVGDQPGLLQHLTEKLARENIDVLYLYGTAGDVEKCVVVFSSTNNERAVSLLNA